MRKMLVLVAAAGVLVLAFTATAAADSAYHTERLALSGVSARQAPEWSLTPMPTDRTSTRMRSTH